MSSIAGWSLIVGVLLGFLLCSMVGDAAAGMVRSEASLMIEQAQRAVPGVVTRREPPWCVAIEQSEEWLTGETFANVNRARVVNMHVTHEGDRLCLRAI